MSWLTSLFSYYLCTEYQLCYKNRATTQCRQRQGNVKIKSQCLDFDILSHIIVVCNIVRPKNQFIGVLLCFLKKVSAENSNWENKRSFWMTCQTKSDKLNICETTHFFFSETSKPEVHNGQAQALNLLNLFFSLLFKILANDTAAAPGSNQG